MNYHQPLCFNRLEDLRAEETSNLILDDIMLVAVRDSGIVMNVHSLMLSIQHWCCQTLLRPPSTDPYMPCDVAKALHLPTLNFGEERFLSAHELCSCSVHIYVE